MIVKSARKSIKGVYPGTIIRLVIIAVIISIVASLLFKEQSSEKMFINWGFLVITSVLYVIWEYAAHKMRKYVGGEPIKEWLEYRIKEVEKNARFMAKFNLFVFGISFLCTIAFYILHQLATKTPPGILTVIVILIGLFIYFWIVGRSLNRNYQKALDELKDLHKQFEDSNE